MGLFHYAFTAESEGEIILKIGKLFGKVIGKSRVSCFFDLRGSLVPAKAGEIWRHTVVMRHGQR